MIKTVSVNYQRDIPSNKDLFGIVTERLRTNSLAKVNTRLAQFWLTSFIGSFCYYCKLVLTDNLVFQNLPQDQAWER